MTSADAQFVDRIVREVMRRLALAPASAAAPPPASSVPAAPPPAEATRPAEATLPPGTLVLHERIVATAQLQDKLQHAQRLIVRRDAIVTPAARDLLKEKQIPWQRCGGELASQAPSGLLACADGTAPAQRLAESLAGDGLPCQVCCDIDQAVRQLQSASSGRPMMALVLTANWASLVCQANRNANIRAAAATDPTSLQQACGQLDVNLLVLDPTRLTETEIFTLARLYLQRRIPGAVRA